MSYYEQLGLLVQENCKSPYIFGGWLIVPPELEEWGKLGLHQLWFWGIPDILDIVLEVSA